MALENSVGQLSTTAPPPGHSNVMGKKFLGPNKAFSLSTHSFDHAPNYFQLSQEINTE